MTKKKTLTATNNAQNSTKFCQQHKNRVAAHRMRHQTSVGFAVSIKKETQLTYPPRAARYSCGRPEKLIIKCSRVPQLQDKTLFLDGGKGGVFLGVTMCETMACIYAYPFNIMVSTEHAWSPGRMGTSLALVPPLEKPPNHNVSSWVALSR